MEQYTELAEGASLRLAEIYTQTVQEEGGRIDQIIQKGDDYLIIYTAPYPINIMAALEIYQEENAAINLN